MKYFAIYHIPSEGYLPQRSKGRKSGYTHDEPSTIAPPRLFTNTPGAKQALRWWLRGAVRIDGWDEGEENIVITPQVHRKKEDMLIIEVDLFPTKVIR
jgi:hypothetical protein